LDGDIITVHKGIAIYKTHASPFWFARIRNPKTRRYVVRSTKETSRIKAREAAEELARDILSQQKATPKEFSFTYYAGRFIAKGRRLVEQGNANYVRTATLVLDNDNWGLVKHFGSMDVRELRTRHWSEFLDGLSAKRPDLSPSTRNMLSATFRNVLKGARDDGIIDDIPDNRVVGITVAMFKAGQPRKATAFYNRWAVASRHQCIRLLSRDPPQISFDAGVLTMVDGEIRLEAKH
jgi:hypothetical protein